ncbi:MAG: DNA polymerase III subunit delta', partial [Chloroflexota bacterium]|nr:DNA polymerase III subunit delta' [Chloroflexota bacterium]
QTKIVNSLQRSLSEGRLAHAYLLVGPQHIGKMTLAIDLAKTLNCLSPEKPCGECHSCRRISSGSHSDIHVIRLAETGESDSAPLRKSIGIEQIRVMQRSVNLKPYEGGCRIIIIDGIEHMSEEAANSLLKTLEEPPPDIVFILLAVEEDSLLPTILSRCHKLELGLLPAPKIQEALIKQWGTSPEQAGLLARLCGGCIGWAISAIDDTSILEERLQNLTSFIALGESDITERFEFAAQLATQFSKNRVLVRERLEAWITWWRDLLLAKIDRTEFVVNIDREDEIRCQAALFSMSAMNEMIKSIRETIQQLAQNANPRLALEVLMLNIPKIEREARYA